VNCPCSDSGLGLPYYARPNCWILRMLMISRFVAAIIHNYGLSIQELNTKVFLLLVSLAYGASDVKVKTDRTDNHMKIY
jgi:hypothetical protein